MAESNNNVIRMKALYADQVSKLQELLQQEKKATNQLRQDIVALKVAKTQEAVGEFCFSVCLDVSLKS